MTKINKKTAKAMGKLGGEKTSEKKAEACRKNGKLGGRPKKKEKIEKKI